MERRGERAGMEGEKLENGERDRERERNKDEGEHRGKGEGGNW